MRVPVQVSVMWGVCLELALHRMWKLMLCLSVRNISTSPGNLPRVLTDFLFITVTPQLPREHGRTRVLAPAAPCLFELVSLVSLVTSDVCRGCGETDWRPRVSFSFSFSVSFNELAPC